MSIVNLSDGYDDFVVKRARCDSDIALVSQENTPKRPRVDAAPADGVTSFVLVPQVGGRLRTILQLPELAFAVAHAAGVHAVVSAARASKAFAEPFASEIPRLVDICQPQSFLFAGEGPDGNFCWHCRSLACGTWDELPARPGGSSGLYNASAGASLGGRIHVVGGTCLFDGTVSAHHCFELGKGSWKTLRSMPTARHSCAAAATQTTLYVFGGVDEQGFELGEAECYDPTADSWEGLPSMPTPRSFWGNAAAVVSSKIYVVGGVTCDTEKTIERYDPAAKLWEVLPAMPTPRVGCSTSSSAGKLYVLGGALPPDEPMKSVECFDPSTGQWCAVKPMPTARRCMALVAAVGKIYAFGGVGDFWDDSPLEMLDLRYGTWTTLPRIPLRATRSVAAALFS